MVGEGAEILRGEEFQLSEALPRLSQEAPDREEEGRERQQSPGFARRPWQSPVADT